MFWRSRGPGAPLRRPGRDRRPAAARPPPMGGEKFLGSERQFSAFDASFCSLSSAPSVSRRCFAVSPRTLGLVNSRMVA